MISFWPFLFRFWLPLLICPFLIIAALTPQLKRIPELLDAILALLGAKSEIHLIKSIMSFFLSDHQGGIITIILVVSYALYRALSVDISKCIPVRFGIEVFFKPEEVNKKWDALRSVLSEEDMRALRIVVEQEGKIPEEDMRDPKTVEEEERKVSQSRFTEQLKTKLSKLWKKQKTEGRPEASAINMDKLKATGEVTLIVKRKKWKLFTYDIKRNDTYLDYHAGEDAGETGCKSRAELHRSNIPYQIKTTLGKLVRGEGAVVVSPEFGQVLSNNELNQFANYEETVCGVTRFRVFPIPHFESTVYLWMDKVANRWVPVAYCEYSPLKY